MSDEWLEASTYKTGLLRFPKPTVQALGMETGQRITFREMEPEDRPPGVYFRWGRDGTLKLTSDGAGLSCSFNGASQEYFPEHYADGHPDADVWIDPEPLAAYQATWYYIELEWGLPGESPSYEESGEPAPVNGQEDYGRVDPNPIKGGESFPVSRKDLVLVICALENIRRSEAPFTADSLEMAQRVIQRNRLMARRALSILDTVAEELRQELPFEQLRNGSAREPEPG